MTRFTDDDIRAFLIVKVEESSYRRLADAWKISSAAYLHRMAHGKAPIKPEVAARLGFELDNQCWVRKQ